MKNDLMCGKEISLPPILKMLSISNQLINHFNSKSGYATSILYNKIIGTTKRVHTGELITLVGGETIITTNKEILPEILLVHIVKGFRILKTLVESESGLVFSIEKALFKIANDVMMLISLYLYIKHDIVFKRGYYNKGSEEYPLNVGTIEGYIKDTCAVAYAEHNLNIEETDAKIKITTVDDNVRI